MTVNSLSEGFIRLTYTGVTKPHHIIIPVNFEGTPTPGTNPDLTRKDGGIIDAEAGLDAFIDVYGNFFNTGVLFGLAEAYTVNAMTEERTFIYAWNANRHGDDGNPSQANVRATMTFKTLAGGRLNVTFMEPVVHYDVLEFPPYAALSRELLMSDYIVSNSSIVIGRDNTYAFTPIAYKGKVDDVLRKRAGW